MNKFTIENLRGNAENLRRFLELEESQKAWIYPLLNRNFKTCISVLEAIEGEEKTFFDLAADLGLHINTVRQLVRGLADEFEILTTGEKAFLPIGRKRLLKRRE